MLLKLLFSMRLFAFIFKANDILSLKTLLSEICIDLVSFNFGSKTQYRAMEKGNNFTESSVEQPSQK